MHQRAWKQDKELNVETIESKSLCTLNYVINCYFIAPTVLWTSLPYVDRKAYAHVNQYEINKSQRVMINKLLT